MEKNSSFIMEEIWYHPSTLEDSKNKLGNFGQMVHQCQGGLSLLCL